MAIWIIGIWVICSKKGGEAMIYFIIWIFMLAFALIFNYSAHVHDDID
jgi:hypothetical protein